MLAEEKNKKIMEKMRLNDSNSNAFDINQKLVY
jgi:hypothetical protein